MSDLTPGSSWGPFRIDSVLGRGPSGAVYRAARNADGTKVSLKIFGDDVDEPTLRRIEDDTRRIIGLEHPHVMRVEAAGWEGSRFYVVSEAFESRSLRAIGSRPVRESAEMLLKAARGLGAAWMRLILHRNLKPENILVSQGGDLRVADFGQFRDATPYWSPERRANRSPDVHGDLYSLGTIFRELVPPGDPDVDALLHHMTRVETFERVQMVEEVVSRLESWLARQPAPAARPTPLPAVPQPPSRITAPAWEIPDPALDTARASVVKTLDAVARLASRLPAPPPPPPPPPLEFPPLPKMPAPPPAPVPEPKRDLRPPDRPAPPSAPPPLQPSATVAPAPPPTPPLRKPPPRRPSSFRKAVALLFGISLAVALITYEDFRRSAEARRLDAVRDLREQGRIAEARRTLEDRQRKDKASAEEKELLESLRRQEWAASLAVIRRLDGEMNYADALAECERYLRNAGDAPPAEAVQLRKSLKAWISLLAQAEQLRKYGADQKGAELLAKAGDDRRRDASARLALWCDADWTKAKAALDAAATRNDPYAAIAEVDRFLQKPHRGGAHQKDAETRKLSFQADIDYAEVADRVESIRARSPADAAAALEGFLAKPHGGGTHRDEALQQLGRLREEAKAVLFAGRASIARLAASPRGTRVAFTSDGVKVLDVASREDVWAAPVRSLLRGLAFAGEDRLVTATSGKVQLWDLGARKELRSFSAGDASVVALAAKPDGRTVLGALSDGTLFTWDAGGDEPPKLEREAIPGVVALALSADGSRLVLAARDRSLRVRDLPSGKERKWAGPPVTVSALALSPDGGRVLAGGANGTVTVWTAETGEAGPGVTGHAGSVTSAAVSPDGAVLATGGADAQVRLASAKDGSTIRVLTGHRGRVSSVAFVPGGLITSGSDGSVRFWTLP